MLVVLRQLISPLLLVPFADVRVIIRPPALRPPAAPAEKSRPLGSGKAKAEWQWRDQKQQVDAPFVGFRLPVDATAGLRAHFILEE